MYYIYTTYIVLYIQGSPQDFIKAVGSSHSAVLLDILIISYWKAAACPLQPPSI